VVIEELNPILDKALKSPARLWQLQRRTQKRHTHDERAMTMGQFRYDLSPTRLNAAPPVASEVGDPIPDQNAGDPDKAKPRVFLKRFASEHPPLDFSAISHGVSIVPAVAAVLPPVAFALDPVQPRTAISPDSASSAENIVDELIREFGIPIVLLITNCSYYFWILERQIPI
jgi:hypothetical protein